MIPRRLLRLNSVWLGLQRHELTDSQADIVDACFVRTRDTDLWNCLHGHGAYAGIEFEERVRLCGLMLAGQGRDGQHGYRSKP